MKPPHVESPHDNYDSRRPGAFSVHCLVQSSQEASEGPAVIIAVVQIRKRDTAESSILPRVVETIEELGCEPRLACLEAVFSIAVLCCCYH